jgi:hypothetical protein
MKKYLSNKTNTFLLMTSRCYRFRLFINHTQASYTHIQPIYYCYYYYYYRHHHHHYHLWLCSPVRAMASSFTRFLDQTRRRATVGRTPLDEWSARCRELYMTTHNTHSRQTFMPTSGIRNHDSSRRAAVDLRLRTRGHWDWHSTNYLLINMRVMGSHMAYKC